MPIPILVCSAFGQKREEITAIKCSRVIDGKSESVATNVVILVEGKTIAVKNDPFKDISVLERVGFVMKDGKVYKNEIRR